MKAKTGAQRKRDYDTRQRAKGLRPVQFWVSAEEKRLIAEFLARNRQKTAT